MPGWKIWKGRHNFWRRIVKFFLLRAYRRCWSQNMPPIIPAMNFCICWSERINVIRSLQARTISRVRFKELVDETELKPPVWLRHVSQKPFPMFPYRIVLGIMSQCLKCQQNIPRKQLLTFCSWTELAMMRCKFACGQRQLLLGMWKRSQQQSSPVRPSCRHLWVEVYQSSCQRQLVHIHLSPLRLSDRISLAWHHKGTWDLWRDKHIEELADRLLDIP